MSVGVAWQLGRDGHGVNRGGRALADKSVLPHPAALRPRGQRSGRPETGGFNRTGLGAGSEACAFGRIAAAAGTTARRDHTRMEGTAATASALQPSVVSEAAADCRRRRRTRARRLSLGSDAGRHTQCGTSRMNSEVVVRREVSKLDVRARSTAFCGLHQQIGQDPRVENEPAPDASASCRSTDPGWQSAHISRINRRCCLAPTSYYDPFFMSVN